MKRENVNFAYPPESRIDPPDSWWDQYEDPNDVAEAITSEPEAVGAMLESGEYDVGGFTTYDKVIKIHGCSYTVCDALVIAALTLPADQRQVLLDDCKHAIRAYLATKVECEVSE